jgi:hypothetical protein
MSDLPMEVNMKKIAAKLGSILFLANLYFAGSG